MQEVYQLETDDTESIYYFESVSSEKTIRKVIQFALISYSTPLASGARPLYNIGFGDVDEKTGQIDDKVESRNGDKDKVLATVALSAVEFLRTHPTAAIYATGSTPTRTRQYQMGLNRFYDAMIGDYVLYGRKDGVWELFERN